MEKIKRLHLLVYGLVQGVFFRVYTEETANSLDLKGWVKNCADESVEILAEGREGNLKKLLDFARKGPPRARVTDVKFEWAEPTDEFDGFCTKYD